MKKNWTLNLNKYTYIYIYTKVFSYKIIEMCAQLNQIIIIIIIIMLIISLWLRCLLEIKCFNWNKI